MDELEIKKKHEGIGGWLYLLCFLLIFGSPIRNLFAIYTEFAETSSYFKEIKGLENFVYIESISMSILMILSIWSGISLVLIKPYAVKMTKVYLVIFLIHGLIQNLFPELAGLDAEFAKEMEYQMKVNTISAILVFGIWFMYLSVSERVENTYSKLKENSNIENEKKYKDFNSKLSSLIIGFKNFYTNQVLIRMKKINLSNLKSDEIIIAAIVVATLIALFFGYGFGEKVYFNNGGFRVMQYNHMTSYDGSSYVEYNKDIVYSEFHFNYVIGIASFLIFWGITYIYLNRKSK